MTFSSRTGRLACVAVLSATAVAGCTNSHTTASGQGKSSEPAHSSTPTTPETTQPATVPADTVSKAPNLAQDDIKAVASAASVTGSAAYPLKGGVLAGKTLATAVNCEGKGTLTVTLKPTGISSPLQCEDGKVSPTFNEVALSQGHKSAYLQFTVSSMAIKWSFAAGWDPHPPKHEDADGAA
ncbi:hypothetical protein OG819_12815 [Streptomyces sp. NBC_01549]|uniref:hypothetical protein n=1 Tax=Streptomyces sp. NBC_01549 TaxID=2975874 RepID=UPI00224CFE56|nr:hypothetical protein [Streptomyces sp. NBC_01549]MCX4590607.1 hypothetical protein [Streptomyces sp. NBC_01549]